MRVSRFLAVVFGLVLFSSVCFDLGLADETDFRLKYSWPSLDIEMMPATAPQPQVGVIAVEASVNMWGDRLGLLTALEMGEFELHGIAGSHVMSPGTPAERIYDYETHNKILKNVYNCDMRVFLGNFIRRWSEAELKVLRDLNFAVILGWNWQHYKFDRTVTDISIVGHPYEDPDEHLLPWSEESGYDEDYGGAYKLKTNGFEFGVSADWAPFSESEIDELKQISVHFLGRYAPVLRAEYFGVRWQDKLESAYGADCEASVTYDFAKLLELKGKQRLSAGLGYSYRLLNGSDLNRIASHGGMFTVSYGLPHSW